jgi:hypothetical protein
MRIALHGRASGQKAAVRASLSAFQISIMQYLSIAGLSRSGFTEVISLTSREYDI